MLLKIRKYNVKEIVVVNWKLGRKEEKSKLWLLAVFLCVLWTVSAIEELPLEKLHSDDGEDEHEKFVDNQNIEDVFQRCHHTVEHRLKEKEKRC